MEDPTRIADRHGILSNNRRGMLIKNKDGGSFITHFYKEKGMCTFGTFAYTELALIGKTGAIRYPKGRF
jgi:hypothetical protein